MCEDYENGDLTGSTDETPYNSVYYRHEKEGLSIYITIYNTNNNANEGSEAGLKQIAKEGGQIAGKGGRNANQGGQIAGDCGQNANQDGEVSSESCGSTESDEENNT